nr:MAG: putative capsid protein 3 [Polycipiviridae sp.]
MLFKMIENEEPEATQIANLQISSASHKLPEQSQVSTCQIPRPFGFEHLIHQWQPMGIRVLLNLPFTGNDKDYVFAIRNGPFIPNMFYGYPDSTIEAEQSSGAPTVPDENRRLLNNKKNYWSYAFNNMRPVIAAGPRISTVKEGDNAVYITYFDQPPNLSDLSLMFRKWRGTMHYRIRTVAGFTTQGYIFASLIRNVPGQLGIFPTQSVSLSPPREDQSYREAMLNSYIMGDTAMFRHFEFQVPFEYPVPYYDQFAWIGNRSRPARNFISTANFANQQKLRPLSGDPVGDNYILIGVRGRLESSVENGQIAFELEYRAGDDFQFSDPFVPNQNSFSPATRWHESAVPTYTIPSKLYTTNGLEEFKAAGKQDEVKQVKREISPVIEDKTTTTQAPTNLRPIYVAPDPLPKTIRNTPTLRRRQRDIGEDTVDDEDLESQPGDLQEVLDLKRNLRKSLNRQLDPSSFQ